MRGVGGEGSRYKLPGPGCPEGGPRPVPVAYVFVSLGGITICRLYKLTLSDQARVSASDSDSDSQQAGRVCVLFGLVFFCPSIQISCSFSRCVLWRVEAAKPAICDPPRQNLTNYLHLAAIFSTQNINCTALLHNRDGATMSVHTFVFHRPRKLTSLDKVYS